MKFYKTDNTGLVVTVAVLGAVAGAVIGLLFAPAKGSETRGKIFSRAKNEVAELEEDADELVENVGDKAQKAYDGLKHKADTAASTIEHKYEDLKNTVKPKTSAYANGNSHGHGHRM